MNAFGGDPQLWSCLTDIEHPSWTIFVPNGAEALCPVFSPPSPSVSEIYQGLKAHYPTMLPVSCFHCLYLTINLSYISLPAPNLLLQASEPANLHNTSSDMVSFLKHDGDILLTWLHSISYHSHCLIDMPVPSPRKLFITSTKSIQNQVLDLHVDCDKMPSPGSGLRREWAILSQHPTH